MIKDIQKKYAMDLALDKPINIGGFELFPVKFKNALLFYSAVEIIKLNKENYNPIYIKMSYYNFLCHYITSLKEGDVEEQRKGDLLIILFSSLFSLVLNREVLTRFNYNRAEKKGEILLYNSKDLTPAEAYSQEKYEIINKDDFEEIRSVIVYQNIPDYINFDNYSKDMKELIKQEEERRAKHSNTTMEDRIDSLIVATGLKVEDIAEMTMRRFSRLYDRMIKKVEYQINKSASMSGFVTFKDESILAPWTETIRKDPLKGIIADFDSTVGKFEGNAGYAQK